MALAELEKMIVMFGGLGVVGVALAAAARRWWMRDGVMEECFRQAAEGDVEGAVTRLRTAIANDDPGGKRSEGLGFLLFREGRWDEAVEAFAAAWRREQRQPGYCVNLAMALAKGGRGEEALAVVEEARRKDTREVAYVCAACLVLTEMGRTGEAVRQLQQAEMLVNEAGRRQTAYGMGLLVQCQEQLVAGVRDAQPKGGR